MTVTTLDFTVYGLLDYAVLIFNAMAAFFGGSVAVSLAKLVLMSTVTVATIKLFSKAAIYNYVSTIFIVFGVYSIMFSLKINIKIYDRVTSQERVVSNIPFILFPFPCIKYVAGEFEKLFTNMIRTPDEYNYEKLGVIFGARLMHHGDRAVITDSHIRGNIEEFVCNCVAIPAHLGIDGTFKINELRNDPNLYKTIFDKANKSKMSKVLGMHYETHDDGGNTVRTFYTCDKAVVVLKKAFDEALKSTVNGFNVNDFNQAVGDVAYYALSGGRTIFGQMAMRTKTLEKFKNLLLINTMRDGVNKKMGLSEAEQFGYHSYLAGNAASSKITFESVSTMLPMLASFIELIIMGLTMIVVFFFLTSLGLAVYFKLLIFFSAIQLWGFLYLLGHLMLSGLHDSVLNTTSSTMVTLASDIERSYYIIMIMGMYCSSIVALSFYFITGNMYSLNSVVAGINGSMMAGISGIGQGMGIGNITGTGNINSENLSYRNETGYQQNYSPTQEVGVHRERNHDGSITQTNPDGTTLYDAGKMRTVSNLADQYVSNDNYQAAITNRLSEQQTKAHQLTEQTAQLHAKTTDSVLEWANRAHHNISSNDGLQSRVSTDDQKALSNLDAFHKSTQAQLGLTYGESKDLLASLDSGLSVNAAIAKLGVSYSERTGTSLNETEGIQKADQLLQQFDVRNSLNKAKSISRDTNYSDVVGKDQSLNDSVRENFSKLENHNKQKAIVESNIKSLDQARTKNKAIGVNSNFDLTEDIISFAGSYSGAKGRAEAVRLLQSTRKQEIVSAFLNHKIGQIENRELSAPTFKDKVNNLDNNKIASDIKNNVVEVVQNKVNSINIMEQAKKNQVTKEHVTKVLEKRHQELGRQKREQETKFEIEEIAYDLNQVQQQQKHTAKEKQLKDKKMTSNTEPILPLITEEGLEKLTSGHSKTKKF